jgi:2-keto-4-pentenoate hydratase/2-oxohepta-3-ene-1,7-dioic acid hydratase in catechol pathway
MRLARYLKDGSPRLALVVDERIHDLAIGANANDCFTYKPLVGPGETGDARALLQLGAEGLALLQGMADFVRDEPDYAKLAADEGPVSEVRLLPPIGNPGKILCLARNYYEGRDQDTLDKSVCTPRIFLKPSSALIATEDEIRVPPLATVVCPEIELTLVIGKRGRDIPVKEADDYIAAYTILNDFSARKLNLPPERMGQPWDGFFDWLNGKWFDTFAVLGPWLTLKSEIDDPSNLDIHCTVAGNTWTAGNTRDMIFSPAETIAFISQITTLEPGDVIATGVPVHEREQEPVKSGDVIEGEIEGLGVIRNRVVWA